LIKTPIFVITAVAMTLALFLATTALAHAQDPDFSITATPVEICVNPGGAGSYVTTISSVDHFSGEVTLADSIDPDATNGPTVSGLPSSVTLTSDQSLSFDVTVSTVQATPTQVYTITIIGGSDVSVHSATVYLAVEPLCGSVGGTIVSVNTLTLLAPYATLAATVIGLATGTTVLLYRRSRVR